VFLAEGGIQVSIPTCIYRRASVNVKQGSSLCFDLRHPALSPATASPQQFLCLFLHLKLCHCCTLAWTEKICLLLRRGCAGQVVRGDTASPIGRAASAGQRMTAQAPRTIPESYRQLNGCVECDKNWFTALSDIETTTSLSLGPGHPESSPVGLANYG
jgi:hypothetical protein